MRGETDDASPPNIFSACAVGREYSNGNVRNLPVRQPDRPRSPAGNVLALASFTVRTVLVASGSAQATAVLLTPSHGVIRDVAV